MSEISKAVLGANRDHPDARCRAVRFLRHDLVNRWQAVSEQPSHGKADRLADPKPFAVSMKTVSLRLNNLADTSVLVRIPSAQARTTKPPMLLRKQSGKPTLACEPMVSAITEVAGLLEPGRCVT